MTVKFYSRSHGLTVRMIQLFLIGFFMIQITMSSEVYGTKEEKLLKSQLMKLNTGGFWKSEKLQFEKKKDYHLKFKYNDKNEIFLIAEENENHKCGLNDNEMVVICKSIPPQGIMMFFHEPSIFKFDLETLEAFKYKDEKSYEENQVGKKFNFEWNCKITCDEGHPLKKVNVHTAGNGSGRRCMTICDKGRKPGDALPLRRYTCDRCYEHVNTSQDWHACGRCDYDVCLGCIPKGMIQDEAGNQKDFETKRTNKAKKDQLEFEEGKKELSKILAEKRDLEKKGDGFNEEQQEPIHTEVKEEQQEPMHTEVKEEQQEPMHIEVKEEQQEPIHTESKEEQQKPTMYTGAEDEQFGNQKEHKVKKEDEEKSESIMSKPKLFLLVSILIIFFVGLFYLYHKSSSDENMENEIDFDESYTGNVIEILPKKRSVKNNKSKPASKVREDEEKQTKEEISDSHVSEEQQKTEDSSDSHVSEEQQKPEDSSDLHDVEEKEKNDNVVNSINLNTTEDFSQN